MKMFVLAAAAGLAMPLALPSAASADPGDHAKKQWEKRAECDEKLREAKNPWEFRKKAAECRRELAKLGFEQRKDAAKAWREAEKRARERYRDYWDDSPYYDWDD